MKTLTSSPFVSSALALIVIMNLVMPLHPDALTAALTSAQEDIGPTHFATLCSVLCNLLSERALRRLGNLIVLTLTELDATLVLIEANNEKSQFAD